MKKEREQQTAKRCLITISIPVYNEEDNIKLLLDRLCRLAEKELQYEFEFLFTDNASTDRTFELIAEQAANDKRIRVLRFSRNFGFQKSILTNYRNARGDAAVQIDADLQDPPELISEFLRKWEEGYKVVYGVRRRRKESAFLAFSRKLYYSLIDNITSYPVPRNAGDFRLVDKLILNELLSVREQTPYLRGIIASLGYAQIGIPYDRDQRKAGESKFNLLQLIEFGLDGITAQSVRPLRLMTIFGFVVSILSMLAGIYYLSASLFYYEKLPGGFTTIVLLIIFLIGLNAFLLGLIGEYVGRIFNNTRGLPLVYISERIEPTDGNGNLQEGARE